MKINRAMNRAPGNYAGGFSFLRPQIYLLWLLCFFIVLFFLPAELLASDTVIVSVSSGPGGTVVPSGDIGIEPGGRILFQIKPDAHFHLDAIKVDNITQAKSENNTFELKNIQGPHQIEVVFAADTFSITTRCGPHGSLTPAGTQVVSFGETRTYTLKADPGYHLVGLFVDNQTAATDSAGQLTIKAISSNHTIEAGFAINTYQVTFDLHETGIYTGGGELEQTVNWGSAAVPPLVKGKNGWQFKEWDRPFSRIESNICVNAQYDPVSFNIKATASPNGTISPADNVSVNYGETFTFAFTPAEHYHLSSLWVDDNIVYLQNNNFTFTNVLKNHKISAVFALDTYTIRSSADTNGNIIPSGIQKLEYGSDQIYKFKPDQGYIVKSIKVDGSESPWSNNEFTISHVTENHIILVTFQPVNGSASSGSLEPPVTRTSITSPSTTPPAVSRKPDTSTLPTPASTAPAIKTSGTQTANSISRPVSTVSSHVAGKASRKIDFYLEGNMETLITDSNRITIGDIRIGTPDHSLKIQIPENTQIISTDSHSLDSIVIGRTDESTNPPSRYVFLGDLYHCDPVGIFFDPGLPVSWSYSIDALDDKNMEEYLCLAFLNRTTKKWETTPTKVDTVNHILSGRLKSLAQFALLIPTTKPAAIISGVTKTATPTKPTTSAVANEPASANPSVSSLRGATTVSKSANSTTRAGAASSSQPSRSVVKSLMPAILVTIVVIFLAAFLLLRIRLKNRQEMIY
jgi:hypothetical protein